MSAKLGCVFQTDFGRDLRLTSERKALVARTIGLWTFSAHEFSDDELLYAAFLILQHVLEMPGLEHWRISQGRAIYKAGQHHYSNADSV